MGEANEEVKDCPTDNRAEASEIEARNILTELLARSAREGHSDNGAQPRASAVAQFAKPAALPESTEAKEAAEVDAGTTEKEAMSAA